MIKIPNRAVDSLEPQERDVDDYDEDHKGFGLFPSADL